MKQKILLFIVIISAVVLSACSSGPGPADNLAQCLTDKGVVMYGTEWCPHCANQKKLFGNSFKLINYVDCDLNRKACVEAGVQGYPTWVFDELTALSGTQQLYVLADNAGCIDAYGLDAEQ